MINSSDDILKWTMMQGEQVVGKILMCVYSALGLLAVRSIYISTLGFLLAMLVQKGLKAWLICGTCVARAIPCNEE